MTRNEVGIIRKVILTMDENEKYEIIKKVADTNGNKKRAALTINCSKRHVNRMIAGYKKEGKTFFVHGNRGRKPVHTLDENTKQNILDLYRTKYNSEANFTHFTELLAERENIHISVSYTHLTLPTIYSV